MIRAAIDPGRFGTGDRLYARSFHATELAREAVAPWVIVRS